MRQYGNDTTPTHGQPDWMQEHSRMSRWTRWLPRLTADRAWLVFFLPALFSYLYMLRSQLNTKQTLGSVERLSPLLDELIDPATRIEVVAEGFGWAEGPVWVSDKEQGREYLLFSDVVNNRVWKWEEGGGLFTLGKTVFLERSGCRTDAERCAQLKEPGANGLARVPASLVGNDNDVVLAMCEHGERRVSLMRPDGTKVALATHHDGRRLNSPNDLAFGKNGDLYFTDPSYGLNELEASPERELDVNGVYRIRAAHVKKTLLLRHDGPALATDGLKKQQQQQQRDLQQGDAQQQQGAVELLEGDMSRPNGIAFSPDFDGYVGCDAYACSDGGALPHASVRQRLRAATAVCASLAERIAAWLYVANSDRARPHVRAYKVSKSGRLSEGRVFFDATPLAAGRVGNPDGLKVDAKGNVFATGPGGVLILSPKGEHLGTVLTGVKTGNVAFGSDGYLYITANDMLQRVKLRRS
ncbi:hypothetical protein JKP88DRAFT_265971 [Tribonema minus]|uniref:SMP-30/Gluconolactonase/LRE-like region domain-containing protein n=1 Tax=Tribonema minus TaxID=303371 RepID=A0A835YH00_9STRA|nr:hypothetical protein JKP88DRAFT_265971 [Tribonema minus]